MNTDCGKFLLCEPLIAILINCYDPSIERMSAPEYRPTNIRVVTVVLMFVSLKAQDELNLTTYCGRNLPRSAFTLVRAIISI